ncbi:MAG: aquaporin [Vicinamibacterales bacterium]
MLLERLRFDSVLEQVGIDKVLHRLGIRQSLNVVLPRLAYFLLLVTEVVMTMMFLFIIFGATDERAPQGFAPIAIGLGLTLIHLISIPVTNTSVNPARSTGVAVFAGGWAVAQLWLFWIAPIVGGVCGAVVYRSIGSTEH